MSSERHYELYGQGSTVIPKDQIKIRPITYQIEIRPATNAITTKAGVSLSLTL